MHTHPQAHTCTHTYTALEGKFTDKCKFKAADHQTQRRNPTLVRNKRGAGVRQNQGQKGLRKQDCGKVGDVLRTAPPGRGFRVPGVSTLAEMKTRGLASPVETHLKGEMCRQPQGTHTPLHPTLKGRPSRPQRSPVGSEGGHFISL